MKQWSPVLVVLLTAACGYASMSDPAADRQAIAAVSAQFAAAENAGDVEEMLLLFAEDLIMAPNAPAFSGTDRIAAATRAFYEAFTVQVEYSSEEIAAFGDWGLTRRAGRLRRRAAHLQRSAGSLLDVAPRLFEGCSSA